MQHSFYGYRMDLKAVAFGGLPTKPTTTRRSRQPFGTIICVGLAACFLQGCTPDVGDRIARAHALARHPSPRKLDRIEALLGDRDRDLRATALVIMDSLDAERAKRMAAAALEDPDGLVRAAAVSIAGRSAEPNTVQILISLAGDDPVWQVRSRALQALAGFDDPAVREPFARALGDSVRQVRKTALRAGVEHPGLLPIDRLSEIVVSDLDWENRADAARALGVSNDPAARAALDAAVADPNEFVRAVASRERRKLPAEPPPEPPNAPPAAAKAPAAPSAGAAVPH